MSRRRYVDSSVNKPVPLHPFHSKLHEIKRGSHRDPCSCPHIPNLNRSASDHRRKQAMQNGYRTTYCMEYGPHSGIPFSRPPPPRTHETKPDTVAWISRRYNPSLQNIKLSRGTHDFDPEKGYHEWRQLRPGPGDYIWQPLERNLFWQHSDRPRITPPARVTRLNPMNEKRRWENIKVLDTSGCLSHGYCQPLPGYGGYVKTSECADSAIGKGKEREFKVMESTTHATYREHPDELYAHNCAHNEQKHKGPLSRMVTLTHPFNPFTLQSAYSNMGATDTTSNL